MTLNANLGSESKFPIRTWQIICYSCVSFSGLFGNALVLKVLLTHKRMRASAFGMYLGSLAIADIFVTSLCIPVYVMSTSSFSSHPTGLAGDVLCKLWTGYFALFYFAVISVFTMVAILIERYFVICHPFKAMVTSTKRKALGIICFIWVFAFVPNIALVAGLESTSTGNGSLGAHCTAIKFSKHYVLWKFFYFIIFLVQYALPIISMVYCTARITSTLNKSKLRALMLTQNSGRAAVLMQISIRKKSIRTVLIMIVSYFGCWTLNQILYFMLNLEIGVPWNGNLSQVSVVLCFCSSCLNPIIYVCRCKHFRDGFTNFLACRQKKRVHHFASVH